MSTERQIIAIAQACGWTWEPDSQTFFHPKNGRVNKRYFPDYPNSLDAMHEAEKALTRDQLQQYVNLLWPQGYSVQQAIRATAAQRAEAFLKIFNLWEGLP